MSYGIYSSDYNLALKPATLWLLKEPCASQLADSSLQWQKKSSPAFAAGFNGRTSLILQKQTGWKHYWCARVSAPKLGIIITAYTGENVTSF